MADKIGHLQMIQNVIDRMGSNSFQLKGWSVLIVSALFALSSREANPNLVYLAYLPAVCFWVLDGYFLWQEQLYRRLYDHARVLPDEKIDYSMNTSVFTGSCPGWARSVFSRTLVVFHGAIVAALAVVTVLTR